jgi:predicted methyltransferase
MIRSSRAEGSEPMRLVIFFILLMSLRALAQDLLKPASPTTRPAAGPEVKPLTHYLGREIAQTMHWQGARWLTRAEREKEEDTKTLLKALDVRPGQTVCDLGAGNGFYTLQISTLVGDNGKVIAQEIQPEMLELLKQRAARAGAKNIDYLLPPTPAT